MREERHIWEYSFDLDIRKLKKYYGKPTYTHAYDEIGKYLKGIGFNNKDVKQGSCYYTSKEYRSQYVTRQIRNMFNVLPWLQLCLRMDTLTIKEKDFYSSLDNITKTVKTEAFKQSLAEYYKNLGVPNPFEKEALEEKLSSAAEKVVTQKGKKSKSKEIER